VTPTATTRPARTSRVPVHPEDKRNPFIRSPLGGRMLSAMQLPLFLLRPPAGYGILTTTGRRTGKKRRRCVRAIRAGDHVYLIAIKGQRTGWAKNALANPEVTVRIAGGTFHGRARALRGADEVRRAREAYCEKVYPFDYLTWMNWRKGRPTPARIKQLFDTWFEDGRPLVVELTG
jgi:deazaflavin-dependent oxidoreductase (nitroreductase family)